MHKLENLPLLPLLILSASAQAARIIPPPPYKCIQNNYLGCISLAVYAQKQDSETPLKMAPSRIKGEAGNACRVADAGAGTGQGQGSALLRPTTTIQFGKKHINDLRFIAEF